ncbi:MAG: Fur family transcriptional regulator [Armatimonadetes bacterium]|nr:Fur family transcriptional regulator [Armatimonadota bacterium]
MPVAARGSLAEALSLRGIRLTRQRRLLLEVLDNAPGHLNARELLQAARRTDPTIDRATVYRTLHLLKTSGLVDELDLLHLEGEEHYYERRRTGDHVHLGCPQCGTISEFETDLVTKLAQEVHRREGFTATGVRIEVRGTCKACGEAQAR